MSNLDDLMRLAQARAQLDEAQRTVEQILWENSFMGRAWNIMGKALLGLFLVGAAAFVIWMWLF